MKPHRPRPTLQPRTAALTRIEVLAVIAGVGLLAVLALPALARGDDKSRTLRCLENLRRLTLGWTLFASDHDDRLVPIRHGADAFYPGSVKPGEQGWAFGWLDWSTAPANTNLSYLVDERFSAIAVYLDRDPSLFRCPDDDSLSPVQRRGKWTWRARSYSANVAVGRGNAETGPWDRTFLHVERMSDLLIPGAAETIVFMEEHADSINDAAFFPPYPDLFVDLPASHHGRAGTFSFADGHVWIRRWASARTVQPVRFISTGGGPVPSGDPDIAWVRARIPRRTP